MILGERQSKILVVVVDDHVRTAEPIGSEYLAQRYNFGVKPATIRNELAAMSEMGYLRQPHTSAGRVPSDLGYRYYVEKLMVVPPLDPAEKMWVSREYRGFGSEIEVILYHTCRILSELARYTSLATPPYTNGVTIKHIALSMVGRGKLLVVTVLSTGYVDHRPVECEIDLSDAQVITLSNLINERFRGANLEKIALYDISSLPSELVPFRDLIGRITAVVQCALTVASEEEICDEVYMDGTSYMLKQPEFSHSAKVAEILDAIEQRRMIFQTLSRALLGEEVSVIIGSENRFLELRRCSFVAARYSVGGKVCGCIGVVGPTRMDYRRAVSAVQFMAASLSDLLTSLSFG